MKFSFWSLLLALLAGLGSARAQTNGTPAAGQAPIGTPITGSEPGTGTPPPGWPTISHDDFAKLAARPVPPRVIYYFFFAQLTALNQVADKQDAKGKDGDYYRRIDQKAAGLTDNEGDEINEIAEDCQQQLDEVDARTKAAIDAHQAEPPTPPKNQSPAPPRNQLTTDEMTQFGRERDEILDEHIEELKSQLGDASFAKLDAYLKAKSHPAVAQPGHLKPHTPEAPPNNGGPQ